MQITVCSGTLPPPAVGASVQQGCREPRDGGKAHDNPAKPCDGQDRRRVARPAARLRLGAGRSGACSTRQGRYEISMLAANPEVDTGRNRRRRHCLRLRVDASKCPLTAPCIRQDRTESRRSQIANFRVRSQAANDKNARLELHVRALASSERVSLDSLRRASVFPFRCTDRGELRSRQHQRSSIEPTGDSESPPRCAREASAFWDYPPCVSSEAHHRAAAYYFATSPPGRPSQLQHRHRAARYRKNCTSLSRHHRARHRTYV